MQALTKSLNIALLYENSDVGNAARTALETTCGSSTPCADNKRYLYYRFAHTMEGLQLSIDAQCHTSYLISSLVPDNSIAYDLIFVFSRCVALNRCYRIGDLVLVDQPDGASLTKQLIRQTPSCFSEIEDSLPQTCPDAVDLDKARTEILSLLSAGKKRPVEIKKLLDLKTQADWEAVLDKVLRPNENELWTKSADYYFELTDKGRAEMTNVGASQTNYPRKPAIHLGSNYCSGRMITSRTDRPVDVITQLSDEVFNSPEVRARKATMYVSAVRCYEGDDVEEQSPYVRSIGNAFVKFMLEVAVRYNRMKTSI